MTASRTTTLLAAGALLLAAPALAQTTTTRTETATSGKSVRLVIAPNLKKDCSSGPLPEIKVVDAPKNGSLITKAGKVKTPASYRCPNKEASVQAIFYQSRAGYTGADAVTVEIKTAEGTIEKQDIRITVGAGGKSDDKKETKTGTDL